MFREFIVNNGVGADGYIDFLNSIVVLKNRFQLVLATGVFGQLAHALFVDAQVRDVILFEKWEKDAQRLARS